MSQEHVKTVLLKAIEGIKSNPGAAKVLFRAETELVENVRCAARVRNFPTITVDEPPDLAGSDQAPNPVELVLVALGTCQEVMYSAYASVMGIPLESVKCNLKGQLDLRGLFALDPEIPAGYQKITYETVLESSADEETIRNLIHMVETHCPVLDTIQRPVEVAGTVMVNGRSLQIEAAE